MVVLLTEERSMRDFLMAIIPALWPASAPGQDWLVLSFQGKFDLKKSIKPKMQSWNYGDPHFIILRDNDGGDCVAIKRELSEIARLSGKPFSVRIVCQELESWLLGDPDAIKLAYPKVGIQSGKAKFRDPDRYPNAAQILQDLVKVHAKTKRAAQISRHFDHSRNRSQSFQVFVTEFRRLIA